MPDNFGSSLIVPEQKGDFTKLSVSEGYRSVSLLKYFPKCLKYACVTVFLVSFLPVTYNLGSQLERVFKRP